MWFIFLQSFVGVFTCNVITDFLFYYLEKEPGYDENSILFTMAPVILILAAGYFVRGAFGDWLFKYTRKGRILVSAISVLIGLILLYLALNSPIAGHTQVFHLTGIYAAFIRLSPAT